MDPTQEFVMFQIGEDRLQAWRQEIVDILASGSLSPSAATFSISTHFGRFARMICMAMRKRTLVRVFLLILYGHRVFFNLFGVFSDLCAVGVFSDLFSGPRCFFRSF